MDWTFYLVSLAVLFGFIVVMLTARIFVNRRLEKREEKARRESEARHIAKTNSGL
jgi:flagellar biosynthesis/type III secretory pathway M-ring protein FliF/YscJ